MGASWEYKYMHSGSPRPGEKGAESISVEIMAPNFSNMTKTLIYTSRQFSKLWVG